VNQHRKSDLLPFLLDLLDFAIEQVELARAENDRGAALDAAMSALAVLKSRAWENQTIGSIMALSPLDAWMFSPRWRDNWNDLAKEPADQFTKSADALVLALNAVKTAIHVN
jgi:hypothetical protein